MWKLTINGMRIGFFEIESHAEMLARLFGATDYIIERIEYPLRNLRRNRMYTKERVYENVFSILDPDGDEICRVQGESDADDLLSHLNR